MITMDIDTLRSGKYKAFIAYAFSRCERVSFVIGKDNPAHNNWPEGLESHCPRDIPDKRFMVVHPEPGTDFDGGYQITLRW